MAQEAQYAKQEAALGEETAEAETNIESEER
jgi:hypothetical protein